MLFLFIRLRCVTAFPFPFGQVGLRWHKSRDGPGILFPFIYLRCMTAVPFPLGQVGLQDRPYSSLRSWISKNCSGVRPLPPLSPRSIRDNA
jgi:hypothetical protein